MSYYQPAVVDSIAALLSSNIPRSSKDAICINIVHLVDNWLLDLEKQGYIVPHTAYMKAKQYEEKRDAVEALMMLSQQPAKSE